MKNLLLRTLVGVGVVGTALLAPKMTRLLKGLPVLNMKGL